MSQTSSTVDWSLADDGGYPMDRSHAAACRLNLQYYLWKDALKFTIHPSIEITANSVIADVATGTAMWLIDVARQNPGVQLDGLDIDLKQAPHPQWLLPSNITLRTWNIFENPPSDLVGKYDFVHVRLLVLVIEGDKPQNVIRNIAKLLKPGGYLQWDELDCVNMHVKKVESSVQAPALDKLREMSYAGGRHDWTLHIPQFLAEGGFQDTKMEYFGDEDALIRAFNEQHLLTMEEFAHGLLKNGKKEAASTFFQLVVDGYKESILGAALCIPRIVCVARKR